MTGASSLRYPLVIFGFAMGVIGMFAAFAVFGPLVAMGIFWVVMAVFGYILYRLLTADVQA